MKEQNDILNELERMENELAHMSRAMPYNVPDGYFEALENNIAEYIAFAMREDPKLDLGKQPPYTVPEGYFDTLQASVKDRINEVPELPKTILPFEAPTGYFETLPNRIVDTINTLEQPVAPTKTISLSGRIWRYTRTAVAAVLLLGLGVGAYKLLIVRNKPVPIETALAKVPDSAISNYVQQNIDDFDAETIATNLTNNDLHELTNQLDDKDIEAYLNENGWGTTE